MSVKWELRVHPVARAELLAIKRNDPAAFEEIEQVLNWLCEEPDPRNPTIDGRLSVCHLYRDAPGWYRIRTLRLNHRVCWRVLETRDGKVVELNSFRHIHEENDGHILQVMQAQPRASAYGKELRDRRKAIAKKEAA